MKVKVKYDYVLFANGKEYRAGEIVDIDEKTYEGQSWKLEVLDKKNDVDTKEVEAPQVDKMVKKNQAKTKGE